MLHAKEGCLIFFVLAEVRCRYILVVKLICLHADYESKNRECIKKACMHEMHSFDAALYGKARKN